MALWNSVLVFEAKEERNQGYKGVMETNVATRSQWTVREDSLILPKIKRLQRNIKKKFQDKSLVDKIPEFTITSQGPKQKKSGPTQMKNRRMLINLTPSDNNWIITSWKI